jgi:hypothetical protein
MEKVKGLFESAKDFRKNVIPPNASAVQVTEMDKAFKAGWATAFSTVTDVCDEYEEQDAFRILTSFKDEIEKHIQDMNEEAIRRMKGM